MCARPTGQGRPRAQPRRPAGVLHDEQEDRAVPVDKYQREWARWRRERGGGRGRGRRGGKTRHRDVIESSTTRASRRSTSSSAASSSSSSPASCSTRAWASPWAPRRCAAPSTLTWGPSSRSTPKVLTGKLRAMYERGIAFHHAGLHVALKGAGRGALRGGAGPRALLHLDVRARHQHAGAHGRLRQPRPSTTAPRSPR